MGRFEKMFESIMDGESLVDRLTRAMPSGQWKEWVDRIGLPLDTVAGWDKAYAAAPNNHTRNILMAYKPAELKRKEAESAAWELDRAQGRGTGYYCYETDLVPAGVPVGAGGRYILGRPVSASFFDGNSKQFIDLAKGTAVVVRWLADNAGRNGFGPERKRRALVDVVAASL